MKKTIKNGLICAMLASASIISINVANATSNTENTAVPEMKKGVLTKLKYNQDLCHNTISKKIKEISNNNKENPDLKTKIKDFNNNLLKDYTYDKHKFEKELSKFENFVLEHTDMKVSGQELDEVANDFTNCSKQQHKIIETK